MMIYKLLLTASALMLTNACFSVMQYRKYIQLTQPDSILTVPNDVSLEIYIALLVGLFSAIMLQTSDLKRQRL